MQNVTNQSWVPGTISFDNSATLGLTGTYDSLAYRVAEIERHFHVRERWISLGGVNLTPFVAVSGNNAYGVETAVLAVGDTPIIGGSAYFDLDKMLIVDVDHTSAYRIQIIYGTGTVAAAIAAFQYTELLFRASNLTVDRQYVNYKMPRLAATTKVWFRVWNATNLSEVDAFFCLHEYEG